MKADLESLKEQPSWCLLVNVTGERDYGLIRGDVTKRKKILQRANVLCRGLGILVKLPNKVKTVCMSDTSCEPREGLG